MIGVLVVGATELPAIGAAGLLHPTRRQTIADRPAQCDDETFAGDAVHLRGWRCRATGTRLGTLVYLHGIADNRSSAVGVVDRFGRRGFDVLAYDSRAHGTSDGDACTFGFFEKNDLHRVLDTVKEGPIVLLGTSLGAAVALQEAASDPRVTTVVAAETFSDLRTIATERAPFVFTSRAISRAFLLAEAEAHFRVDEVSPVRAASAIAIPVLLIHGAADTDTPPDHSKRVLAALHTRKRLILVPGGRHNESLRSAAVWQEIDRWIDEVVGSPSSRRWRDADPEVE